jgi:hypothetical protein
VEKREEFAYKTLNWHIAARPANRKTLTGIELKLEQIKASMGTKVQHPFRRINNSSATVKYATGDYRKTTIGYRCRQRFRT